MQNKAKRTAHGRQRTVKNSILFAASCLLIFAPALAVASEGGGGHEVSTFLGIPVFVWFTIVNFIIFAAILFVTLRKPLINFLKGRRETVGKEIEDAQRLLDEAEQHHAEVTGRLDKLESEIASMRDQIMKEGESEGERILERAEQASERLRREADFQADQEVKMARKTLREEAARLAVKLAEETLQKAVTEKDRDRLVNEFLREVSRK